MNKVKVLITDGLAANGVDVLKSASGVSFDLDLRSKTDASELGGMIGQYDCVVVRSATTITRELIEKASQMKLIVRAGAGVDNIDVKAASERNIPVMNTASANSLAAAEQTIALLFAMFRQVPQSAWSLREGKWERDKFKGNEVTGKTLGVVGLGNIGRYVAEKAVGLGMKVVAFDPMVKALSQVPSLRRLDESISVVSTLDELLPMVDVLTLHVPKVKETANLISTAALAKMKKGSFVINCARGGIVDEKAVLAAIESGQLAGAAFDVFEKEPPVFPNPLFTHPKVVCVPHLGASTHEAQTRVASTAAEQMIGFFARGDRTGIVN